MDLNILLVAIASAAAIWFVVSTIRIFDALQKRGIEVHFLLLRLLAIHYAGQYKALTREESGRTGPLFYHWIISINVALAAVLLLLLLNVL